MLTEYIAQLDSKYDVDVEGYFELSVEERDELSKKIFEFFIPILEQDLYKAHPLRLAFEIKLDQYIELEKFEYCDLYSRIIREIINYAYEPE